MFNLSERENTTPPTNKRIHSLDISTDLSREREAPRKVGKKKKKKQRGEVEQSRGKGNLPRCLPHRKPDTFSDLPANGMPNVDIQVVSPPRESCAEKDSNDSHSSYIVTLIQKIIAELFATYFVVFAGCGSVAVNKVYGGTITFPGICITWGLIVMVMIYSVGHISGAHFNPAVTVTFAIFRRFPWKEVPLYILSQVTGSILASATLKVLFDSKTEHFFGTVPVGSDLQSLILEFIISFLLMFVISGVATDNRAVGELAGLAIGSTITLNVFVAGPISGASMNPARSLGPAIAMGNYKGLWVYMVGPLFGIFAGAFTYNLIRFTKKPLREITKSSSFLRSVSRRDTST